MAPKSTRTTTIRRIRPIAVSLSEQNFPQRPLLDRCLWNRRDLKNCLVVVDHYRGRDVPGVMNVKHVCFPQPYLLDAMFCSAALGRHDKLLGILVPSRKMISGSVFFDA